MDFKYKKIQTQGFNKIKKPICNEKKENTARICTNEKCNNKWNQIMCGINSCPCNNKIHENCYSFINFECFKNIINQYHTRSNEDIFKSILTFLNKIAEQAIVMYNRALAMYENYLVCQPLVTVKKNMNDDGAINKQNSMKLKKFFDSFPEYVIPHIKQQEKPKLKINEIRQICVKFQKEQTDAYKKLFKSLLDYEDIAKQIIQQTNIQQNVERQKLRNKSVDRNKSNQKR